MGILLRFERKSSLNSFFFTRQSHQRVEVLSNEHRIGWRWEMSYKNRSETESFFVDQLGTNPVGQLLAWSSCCLVNFGACNWFGWTFVELFVCRNQATFNNWKDTMGDKLGASNGPSDKFPHELDSRLSQTCLMVLGFEFQGSR